MYSNRQLKYHKASLTALRTRLEAMSQARCEVMRIENSDSNDVKQYITGTKEIQRALKLVANEIESESE